MYFLFLFVLDIWGLFFVVVFCPCLFVCLFLWGFFKGFVCLLFLYLVDDRHGAKRAMR